VQYTDQFGISVRKWDKVYEDDEVIMLYAQWPINISTRQDFDMIREHPEGSYILTNNIIIGQGNPWTPIGIDHNSPFTGTLDGNGYSILSLYINYQIDDPFNGYAGVIGYNKGVVRNLNLGVTYDQGQPNYSNRAVFIINSNTELYVGGIAGYNEGLIQNCNVALEIDIELNADNADMYVGGIAGYNNGRIENANITVEINADYGYGVSEGEKYIGSIAGYHAIDGMISDCYYNRITNEAQPKAWGNEDEPEGMGDYENVTGNANTPPFW